MLRKTSATPQPIPLTEKRCIGWLCAKRDRCRKHMTGTYSLAGGWFSCWPVGDACTLFEPLAAVQSEVPECP